MHIFCNFVSSWKSGMLIVRHNNEILSRMGNTFVYSVCNDLLIYAKHEQVLTFCT